MNANEGKRNHLRLIASGEAEDSDFDFLSAMGFAEFVEERNPLVVGYFARVHKVLLQGCVNKTLC